MSELNIFTPEDCETVVRYLLTIDNVVIKNVQISQLTNQEFSLHITVSYEGKEEILNFAAQCLPEHTNVERIFTDYKKALPKFDNASLTPPLIHVRSKYYLVEDLNKPHFRTCNSKSLPLNHLKLVLKVLGKLHAASYAFEEIQSKTKSNYTLDQAHEVKNIWVDLNNVQVSDLISSLLDKNYVITALKDLEERQAFNKFRRTLCHGNLIVKNILFKYENGVPVECKLINFSRKYAPSICDVLQLILFTANDNLRQHHFHNLLQTYDDSLKEELTKYYVDVDNILADAPSQTAPQFLPLIKLEAVLRLGKSDRRLAELKEALTCPIFSREDCFAVIKNKNLSNYKFVGYKVTPLDEVNGFLGDYHWLKIKIRQQSDDITLNCFLKRFPKANASSLILQDSGGFFKEEFVYTILATKFQEMEINTFGECFPACYFHRHKDFFVFEDMSVQDFSILPASKPYDFELLSVTVKKTAKFHASALVYEEKMSEKLGRPYRLNQDYAQFFVESIFVKSDTHAGGRLSANSLRAILIAAELLPEIQTEENQRNLQRFWPQMTEAFYTLTTSSEKYRNTLTHGDLWSSNILVRFEDDAVADCRFVDYQLLKYCPPGQDLLSVLHLNTDRATRLTHEAELTQIYYTELTNIVNSYGYDIDTIYPYEEFQRGLDHMRPQMVVQAIMYGMLSFCTSEDIAMMLSSDEICNQVFFGDRTAFLTEKIAHSPLYKKGISERIQDLYDYCNFLASIDK